jgi:hypothetical protein
MAAGLGFKDFTTGEVLTAADVDGYLMQGVWVFASAAARDAAVTAPQEGNFAYLKDTNVTTYYTGSAWANLDTTGMTNPMTTTGDTIYSSSGSTPARLGIGSTGQVLTVAGGIPSWATPAGGSSFVGCSLKRSTNLTINTATITYVEWDDEFFDTNSFHDNSTNPTRITIPSGKGGYYLFVYNQLAANPVAGTFVTYRLRKNGTQIRAAINQTGGNTAGYSYQSVSFIVDAAVGDYFDVGVSQNSGGTMTYYFDALEAGDSNFSCTYLGA